MPVEGQPLQMLYVSVLNELSNSARSARAGIEHGNLELVALSALAWQRAVVAANGIPPVLTAIAVRASGYANIVGSPLVSGDVNSVKEEGYGTSAESHG